MIANERTGKMERYPSDTVELHSSYKNNFWVVGSPDGKYGYYDRQTISNYQWYKDHDYNYYRVYALGEWGSIKTGGEFLYAFDSNKHIKRHTTLKGCRFIYQLITMCSLIFQYHFSRWMEVV